MSEQKKKMGEQIKELMQAIARRKPGKCKLVYDKKRHTILAISSNGEEDTGMGIPDDDGIF